MNAVEVMTSESQERMLAIVEPERLDAVLALARKWEIRATVVGRVTDSDRFRVFDGVFDALGVPGENPPPPIGDVAAGRCRPTARRWPTCRSGASATGRSTTGRGARPPEQDALLADDPAPRLRAKFPVGADLGGELLALLATPTIADKTWVSRQYDHQLFLSTVAGPGRRRRGAAGEGHDARRSRSRPTARRASATSIRASARGSSCSRPRATSRAPERGRSRS